MRKEIIYFLVALVMAITIPLKFINENIVSIISIPKMEKKIIDYKSGNFSNLQIANDKFITMTDDSSITVTGVNQYIATIRIDIKEINDEDCMMQVFFDYGNGINEGDSQYIKLNVGTNIMKLKKPGDVNDVRLDFGNEASVSIAVEQITTNEFSTFDLLFIIIAFVLGVIVYLIIRGRKHYLISGFLCYLLMYQLFKFLYLYRCETLGSFVRILVFSLMIIALNYFVVSMFDQFFGKGNENVKKGGRLDG